MFSAMPYLLAQQAEEGSTGWMFMLTIGICAIIGLLLFIFLIVAAACQQRAPTATGPAVATATPVPATPTSWPSTWTPAPSQGA